MNKSQPIDVKSDEKGFEVSYNEHQLDVDAAGRQTLAEGQSPWKVLLENKWALAIILAVQSNAIVVGVEFSLPGNLLGIPAFNKVFGSFSPASQVYVTEARVLTIWASLFACFQVLGQFSGGFPSDRIGRRWALFSILLFTYVGVVLEIVAHDWQMWLGSKIVVGFATGLMQSTVPTYVAEISPRELRGIMLGFFNLAMNIGQLAATLIPWGTLKAFPDINDQRSFRVPLYVALALPTVSLVAQAFLLVESPWWLVMGNRSEEAKKSLSFINRGVPNYSAEDAVRQLEYTLLKEADSLEISKGASYFECLRGTDLRRTFVAVFPAITQNLSGQNLVGTYATYFFQLAGQADPLISSVIVTAVGMCANIGTFFIIESKKIGRFGLLFTGVTTMTVCMLGIALVDTISHNVINKAGGAMLVFFLAIFSAASSLGPGVAGWAYAGESGSARLRAKTTTLGTVGNALIGLLMTSVLPYLLNADEANWGAKTGFLFFGLGCLCVTGIWFGIPEYSGRSYAQIDELFVRKVPARKFRSTVCTGDYGRDIEQV